MLTYFMWDKHDKGELSGYVFQYNRVYFCPAGKKFTCITLFSYQKNVAMILPTYSTLLSIFLLGISCSTITSTGAWIQVQNVGASFHPNLQLDNLISCIISVPTISNNCLPCIFFWICHHFWHQQADIGTGKLFINCHYTAFTNG